MGKTTTPKYRIELTCISFINRCREVHTYPFIGIKPTERGAKQFRDDINLSIEEGVNKHLKGTQSKYSNATVIEQKSGRIAAQYIAPKFELI